MQIVDLNFLIGAHATVSGTGTGYANGTVQIIATGSLATGQGSSESGVVRTGQFIWAWNRTTGVAISQGGSTSVKSSSTSIVRL